MDGRDGGGGAELRKLAARLEALERENGHMRRENAERIGKLEQESRRVLDENAALRARMPERPADAGPADRPAAVGLEGRVSRGTLLTKAGAAAVAAAAAAALLPREAWADHHSDDFVSADLIDCHELFAGPPEAGFSAAVVADLVSDEKAGVKGINGGGGQGVLGINAGTGPAVEGLANGPGGTGVEGTGRYGVWGESNQAGFYGVTGRNTNTDGTGVRGVANNTDGRAGVRGEGSTGVWGSSPRPGRSGVYGQHTGTFGYGVVGDGKGGTAAGVLGRNSAGTGVRGEGSTAAEVSGVRGLGKTGVWGSTSATGYSGVYGQHTGTSGFGVVGDGMGPSRAGVLGRNSGGYGGQFQGGQAQLRLVPGGSAGRPTTGAHLKGELYMDANAALWVCVADGTPGTWRRVTVS